MPGPTMPGPRGEGKQARERDQDRDPEKSQGPSKGKALGKAAAAKRKRLLTHEARIHLKRQAQLERLSEIAAQKKDDKLAQQVTDLRAKETARHERAMSRIRKGERDDAPEPALPQDPAPTE